ncbi:MAG TPA: XRE family transcriptional regulator [Bacteroidales bacterium]|nr:MAG: hypothetical protein A2X01_13635 [Bacteroidetes bacterium GWF2_35_48]HBX52044.1 XRE family transcriptional regulator [Bacteroidales bacterium]
MHQKTQGTKKILQRQLAALLETDTAFISKLEKGNKKAFREQVLKLADYFNIDKDELLTLWLGEKIYDVIKDESVTQKALKIAEKRIKNHK